MIMNWHATTCCSVPFAAEKLFKRGNYCEDTMKLMDVLDAKDTEKCRKMGAIRVESARIRVKVFRECDLSVSWLEF